MQLFVWEFTFGLEGGLETGQCYATHSCAGAYDQLKLF